MSESKSGGSLGLCTVLFLIFLVLMLTGNIGWSWWWVTAPLWMSVALVATVLIGFLVVVAVAGGVSRLVHRRPHTSKVDAKRM